jgi:hypothetical protein
MSRKAKLLSFAEKDHPHGGFQWTGYDVSDAIEIAKTDPDFAKEMVFIPSETPVAPASRFCLGPVESYVKCVVLEELGVLAQVKSISKTKHGQIAWIMGGVCPFHRRVHGTQNWVIVEGRPGKPTIARCMKPLNKRFTAAMHYPSKILGGELNLSDEKHKDRVY